jgi:tRNA(Ile)-lysidine synthase TilS/MesJ
MTTLVMFSGGLDSTAMLVKLLEETKDELRVHHIRMANKEGRAEAEQAAVERIVAWCRDHYRPFRYSESALDFTALEAIPIDYGHRESLGAPAPRLRDAPRVLPRAEAG